MSRRYFLPLGSKVRLPETVTGIVGDQLFISGGHGLFDEESYRRPEDATFIHDEEHRDRLIV